MCFGFFEEVWLEDGLISGPIGRNGMAWVLFLLAFSLFGFFLDSLSPSLLFVWWHLFSYSCLGCFMVVVVFPLVVWWCFPLVGTVDFWPIFGSNRRVGVAWVFNGLVVS